MPTFGPEKVTAFELGFKGLYKNKRILFDGYIFYNNYNGFLAQQLLAQNPDTPTEKRFITTVSLDQPVSSYGWALGLDYKLVNNYDISSNLSFNDVNTVLKPGFQTFNTPDYRFNLSFGNRKLTKVIDLILIIDGRTSLWESFWCWYHSSNS